MIQKLIEIDIAMRIIVIVVGLALYIVLRAIAYFKNRK